MSTRSADLTPYQLEVVVLLANGKSFAQIAREIDRSMSYVTKQAFYARKKLGANNTPHMISLLYSSGQLEWDAESESVVRGRSSSNGGLVAG